MAWNGAEAAPAIRGDEVFFDRTKGWRPSPWEPDPSRPRLSRRGERVILWVISFNLLMLLLAPIGGASLIDALLAMLSR